jgi:Putative metal-binding motif
MVCFSFKRRFGLVAGLVIALVSVRAEARKNGIASEGCSGCHSGGTPPTVTVTSSVTAIVPSQMVTITVNITTAGGYAGLYMTTDVGTLASLAGEGTQLASGGITHTSPKKAVGGVATFHVGWTAPATMGGVNFNIWAVAANGDGGSKGDGPGTGFESFPIGCAGTLYYRDFDGDGFGGADSGYTRNCSKPMYYANVLGDCNDSDERIYPGATEVCNKRDDNCNGQIDEGLPIVTYHVDADGDGHGSPKGPTVMDCTPPKGYAPGVDDCDDTKPTVYAGAQELCDYIDNNCNGQTDENARTACGTGWCRRLGDGCDTTTCTPGLPRAEICNAFDDDCDGVADNGTDLQLCGAAGLKCVDGTCYKAGSIPDAGTSTGAAGLGGGTSGDGAGAGTDPTGAAGASGRLGQGGCALAGGGEKGEGPFALGALLVAALFLSTRAARRRRLR